MATIVLVEDEEILQELMRAELERQGYLVHQASDGQAGWELIQKVKPDLILLDLMMPVMTGYEVLQKLQEDPVLKEIPCVVLSNSGQADDLNRAYAYGAKDVLIKTSFDPVQLMHKVKGWLQ